MPYKAEFNRNLWMRERRITWKEWCKCQDCGKPSGEYSRCFTHRLYQADRQKAYRERRKNGNKNHRTIESSN